MELSTLGIGVDSKPVDDANKKLDEFVTKAGKAEDAGKKIGDGAKQGAKGFDDLEGAMTRASIKGNVIGDAIEAGVRRAMEAVKALYSLLSQVGDYQDFADMTGASAVNIAKLQTAADVAGVSMGTLTNQMNQMTRMLAQSDEESDKAANALKRIGINWKEFMQMDPAERLVALSAQMNKYQNSAELAEVKQALFGRGAGEVGKVIVALGDGTEATTMLTEQLISTQDDLNDSNAKLTSQMRQWIQFVLTGATPALSAFMGAIGDSVTQALGLGNASDALGANKGIEIFAIGAARLFAQVIEAGQVVYRVIEGLVSGVMTLGQAVGAVLRGDWEGVTGAFEKHATRVKEIMNRELFSQSFERNLDKYYAQQVQKQYDTENKVSEAVAAGTAKQMKERQKAADKAAKEAERARKAIEKELQKEKEAEEKFRMKFGREQAIEQGEAVLKANEEYQKQLEKFRKAQEDADAKSLESSQDQVNAINDRAAAIEEATRTHGMLRSVIEEEHLAILERDRAEFEGSDVALAQLEKRIDAQRRLIDAIKGQETQQAAEKAATASQQAFDRAWDQVGQSLADEIMKGGGSAKDWLERTFKNLILRPTIMAAAVGAVGGAAAGQQAAGGNPLASVAGSIMGNIGSLFGVGGIGGAVAAGAGWLTGATTLGGSIAAGASLIGTGSLAGVASGLGMLAGALGPIAIGVYGLAKLFGGKKGGPKVEGSAGFGAGNAADYGRFGNEMDAKMNDAVNRIDQMYKQIAGAMGAINSNVKFGVGVSMDPRGTAPSFLSVQASNGASWQSRNVGRSEEEFQAALSEASAFIIVEALRSSGIDQEVMAYFDQISAGLSGEAKLAAFETAAQMAMVWQAMKNMSTVVGGLGTISMQATANLVQFAGGIDKLAAGLQAYQANFFSASEQMAMTREQMAKQLNAPGSGWSGWTPQLLESYDKAFFRKVVEGLDLTTEAGQRQFASMMNVASGFAALEAQEEAEAARRQAEAQQAQAEAERRRAEAEAARQKAEEEAKAWTELNRVIDTNIFSLQNLGNAHEMLIGMLAGSAGGVREFTSQLQGLLGNFSTFAERRQSVGLELSKAFRETGASYYAHLGNPQEVMKMAREDFIQIFRTIDLSSASGRKLASEMLRLQGAFAGVTQQIREPVYYTVDSALQAINDKYQEQVGKLKEVQQGLKAANNAFRDFSDSMKLDDSLSTLTPGQKMTESMTQYQRARIEMERDNYSQESVGRFTEIARKVLDQGRTMYGSGSAYDALFEQVKRDMEQGQIKTAAQLSNTERQIAALDTQVAQFKQANNTLTSIDQGIQILYRVWRGEMVVQSTPWGARGAGLYGSHADGLPYVPRNGYMAELHQGEAVLTAPEAGFMRSMPSFTAEVRALRREVSELRKENRQDAGNTIGATFQAAQLAAKQQAEATMRAANKRQYHEKKPRVLS